MQVRHQSFSCFRHHDHDLWNYDNASDILRKIGLLVDIGNFSITSKTDPAETNVLHSRLRVLKGALDSFRSDFVSRCLNTRNDLLAAVIASSGLQFFVQKATNFHISGTNTNSIGLNSVMYAGILGADVYVVLLGKAVDRFTPDWLIEGLAHET